MLGTGRQRPQRQAKLKAVAKLTRGNAGVGALQGVTRTQGGEGLDADIEETSSRGDSSEAGCSVEPSEYRPGRAGFGARQRVRAPQGVHTPAAAVDRRPAPAGDKREVEDEDDIAVPSQASASADSSARHQIGMECLLSSLASPSRVSHHNIASAHFEGSLSSK
jgi:hypothetical protein